MFMPPPDSLLKTILKLCGKSVVENTTKSIEDNYFRSKVLPKVGSVVTCELHTFEHSGIYIGNNDIVHLNGSGKVEIVTPEVFLDRFYGFNNAISILVSSCGEDSVGSDIVAKRAKEKAGESLNYSLLTNNCHKFVSGCLTGNFEELNITYTQLLSKTRKTLNNDNWRSWDFTRTATKKEEENHIGPIYLKRKSWW